MSFLLLVFHYICGACIINSILSNKSTIAKQSCNEMLLVYIRYAWDSRMWCVWQGIRTDWSCDAPCYSRSWVAHQAGKFCLWQASWPVWAGWFHFVPQHGCPSAPVRIHFTLSHTPLTPHHTTLCVKCNWIASLTTLATSESFSKDDSDTSAKHQGF